MVQRGRRILQSVCRDREDAGREKEVSGKPPHPGPGTDERATTPSSFPVPTGAATALRPPCRLDTHASLKCMKRARLPARGRFDATIHHWIVKNEEVKIHGVFQTANPLVAVLRNREHDSDGQRAAVKHDICHAIQCERFVNTRGRATSTHRRDVHVENVESLNPRRRNQPAKESLVFVGSLQEFWSWRGAVLSEKKARNTITSSSSYYIGQPRRARVETGASDENWPTVMLAEVLSNELFRRPATVVHARIPTRSAIMAFASPRNRARSAAVP